MSNKNNNDKNRQNGENYDRRIITDPPAANEKQRPEQAVSAKRKGLYIILLLGITAIGIYAILSAVIPKTTKNANETYTGSAYATPLPNQAAVPANAAINPIEAEKTADPSPAPTAEEAADTVDEATPGTVLAQAPVSGKIIKDFSDSELIYSETMMDWRTHSGVDIAASPDTIVTAIKDGTLKKAYEDSLLGTTVIIHHDDDGTDSVYSNLKDVTNVPIGSDIKTGDVLGKVGGTAVSEINDESHLHFEIRLDDVYLDPKEFVKFEEVDYVQPEELSSAAPTSDSAETISEAAPSYSPDPYTDGEDIETMIID